MASNGRPDYAGELKRRHLLLQLALLLLLVACSLATLAIAFRRLVYQQLLLQAQAVRQVAQLDPAFQKDWLATNPSFYLGLRSGNNWQDNAKETLDSQQLERLAASAGPSGQPSLAILYFEGGYHFVLCEQTASGFFVVARRGENAWFFLTAAGLLLLVFAGFWLLNRPGLRFLLDPVRAHVADLQQLNQAKEAFFAGIFHELGTPLTSLMSRLELLLASDRSDKRELERAYLDALRIAQLSSDQLLRARIETGHFSLQQEPCAAEDLVEALELRLERLLLHHNKCLKAIHPPGLIFRADRLKLEQALVNLVVNAVKYAPEGETIELTFEKHEGIVQIEVHDQGKGFDLDKSASLQEPFQRGPSSNRQGQGLGLFLAREIAKAHGGDLSFRKTESGFAAEISLPDRLA